MSVNASSKIVQRFPIYAMLSLLSVQCMLPLEVFAKLPDDEDVREEQRVWDAEETEDDANVPSHLLYVTTVSSGIGFLLSKIIFKYCLRPWLPQRQPLVAIPKAAVPFDNTKKASDDKKKPQTPKVQETKFSADSCTCEPFVYDAPKFLTEREQEAQELKTKVDALKQNMRTQLMAYKKAKKAKKITQQEDQEEMRRIAVTLRALYDAVISLDSDLKDEDLMSEVFAICDHVLNPKPKDKKRK